MARKRKPYYVGCFVCGREEGSVGVSRFGEPECASAPPLGALQICERCGHPACPDCLHEGECCEEDAALAKIPASPWQGFAEQGGMP